MSDGGYTGAMDVWALGCIFAELLQRQQQHGGVHPVPPTHTVYSFNSKAFDRDMRLVYNILTSTVVSSVGRSLVVREAR